MNNQTMRIVSISVLGLVILSFTLLAKPSNSSPFPSFFSRLFQQTHQQLLDKLVSNQPVNTMLMNPSICWAISDEGNPDNLFKFDGTTWTQVGSTGVNGIEALGFDTENGIVYTVSYGQFGRVDTLTGAFIPIGTGIGTGLMGAEGSYTIQDIDGLSFDPYTGILWATERRQFPVENLDYLLQIDPLTGAYIPDAFGAGIDYVPVDSLFDTGRGFFVKDVDDIAIDPYSGELYAIQNQDGSGGMLTILNKADGSLKEVVGSFAPIDDIESLGFYNDGNFYGSTGNNSPDPVDLNRFFIINKADASLTEIAPIDTSNVQKDFEACDCLTGEVNVITGTIFHDIDQDTLLTAGDIGEPNVTVNLYRDVDGNGNYNPLIDTFLLGRRETDAAGLYEFRFAGTGDFVINIDETDLPLTNLLTTDDIEFSVLPGTGLRDDNNDFGYRLPCVWSITNTQNACIDNATSGDSMDDYFTITINATVMENNGGTEYEVVLGANPDGTGGTILTTATYGIATTVGFDTDNTPAFDFAADGVSVYEITLRDATGSNCFETFMTTPVAACSTCPPTICLPVNLTKS